MEAVCYNIANRELWSQKSHLHILCGVLNDYGSTINYLIMGKHLLVLDEDPYYLNLDYLAKFN